MAVTMGRSVLHGVFVGQDRPNLVLDFAEVCHNSGFDLDNMSGQTKEGRFIIGVSGLIPRGQSKAVANDLHRVVAGVGLTTIDGETFVPHDGLLKSIIKTFGIRRTKPCNGLLALGQPRSKDWIEFRRVLARANRPVSSILELDRRDVEGAMHTREWGMAVISMAEGPNPPSFKEDLQHAFRGSVLSCSLPGRAAARATKIRSKVTVRYLADDLQGVFFELMHGIQTSRAIVFRVEAERYVAAHHGGQGFTSEFELLVSGVQHQHELESLFKLRKQLAFDVEVKFGWESESRRKAA